MSQMRGLQLEDLHDEEDPDFSFIGEAGYDSETADTEVKQLDAEVRQQETRTNLISNMYNTIIRIKKRSERRKTCALAVVRRHNC